MFGGTVFGSYGINVVRYYKIHIYTHHSITKTANIISLNSASVSTVYAQN